ncbi:ribosome maturation factor RimM [Brassicibacter mesophilus]|jgi:16S rRNA processing protein RimM|uniref:ribosome maturation factor RimM n=1 Tax=Brassicibacter mesophilus TaxID=745119 RepID=UPI003D1A536A
MDNYIRVGKILNTHGIKGDLKVLPLTDEPSRFEKLKTVFIDDENSKVEIEKVWYSKGFVMIRLNGYNDINEVIKFKNCYILIDEKDALKLPKDSFFISQIIGLTVFLSDGNELGEVVEVLQPGANDVYVIRGNNKEFLIPAVKEFVKEIDLDNNRMVIDPIEGLIE